MRLNLSAELHVGAAVAYPDLTCLDPRKKLANGGAYVLQYGRAFLYHYLSSGSQDFYNGNKSGRYREALLYAKGQQDAGQYAVLRQGDDQANATQRRGKLDKRPLQLLPKYVDAVLGLLKARDYTPTVTPLDTMGEEEAAEYRAAIQAYMYHGEFLKSLGLGQPTAPNGQPLPAELPIDEEDLDLMLADYKGVGAMRLEVKTAQSLNKGHFADQDKQCQYDDAVYGSSVVGLMPAGIHRVPRRLAPGKCFFLPSDTGFYDNLQAGAHLESITLGTLLSEMEAAGYKPKKEELDRLKTLARPHSPTATYEYSRDLDGMPEAGGTIQVVRFSFLSTDRVVKALGSDKLGNPRWVDKPATYTNPKNHYADVKTQDVVNVYEGTLVDGTEIGYGARLAHAQLRDPENPFVAHPLYVVTSPGMHGGISDSLVERTRPVVDMAAREFMKLQDALSKLPDSAIAINLALLAQVSLDGGKKEMTGDEIMRSFFRDGVLVYNGLDEEGNPLPSPISQIPIDITAAVTMRMNNIQQCIGMIEQITGANGAVAGANAAPDQGKGTTELAIQGSQNTLEFLFFAKQNRFERVCRAIAANIKANDPDLAARTMQVKVEQKPTQQEWSEFYASLANYALADKINPDDEAAIRQIDNLKEARRLLASRVKRKRIQMQEDAQKNTDYATQQQTAAAEAAEKFKQQTLTLQDQLDEKAELRRRETQLLVIREQAAAAERTARITQDGRLEGIGLQNHGALQRELVKQESENDRHSDKLDTQEYISDNKPTPSAK